MMSPRDRGPPSARGGGPPSARGVGAAPPPPDICSRFPSVLGVEAAPRERLLLRRQHGLAVIRGMLVVAIRLLQYVRLLDAGVKLVDYLHDVVHHLQDLLPPLLARAGRQRINL